MNVGGIVVGAVIGIGGEGLLECHLIAAMISWVQ